MYRLEHSNRKLCCQPKISELIGPFIFTLLCGLPYSWDPKREPWELCYEGFSAWWTRRLVEYVISEDFPHDPVNYISEHMTLAILARMEAEPVLHASASTEPEDILALAVLYKHLQEKYGESTAEGVIALVENFLSEKKNDRFLSSWEVMGMMRNFFILRDGHIGIGPWVIRESDNVAILSGGKVPYCLRSIEDSGYMFLGECYVHGIMYGEACEGPHNRMFKLM